MPCKDSLTLCNTEIQFYEKHIDDTGTETCLYIIMGIDSEKAACIIEDANNHGFKYSKEINGESGTVDLTIYLPCENGN